MESLCILSHLIFIIALYEVEIIVLILWIGKVRIREVK